MPGWCTSSRAIACSPSSACSTTCCWRATACAAPSARRSVEEALAFFPEIAAKRNDRAVTLSGGQQQMLAVAQGLVRRPRLLMLDEPSAGLSPVLVDRVLAAVARCATAGTAVLLVEQLIEKALSLPTASMRWRAARLCSKRARTRTTCRIASSTPISARTSALRSLHSLPERASARS